MADTGVIDAARQEEFVGKVVEQISGTMTTLLAAVGDRLGLFKNLAEQGPATSAELASRTNLNERYLREWLGGMATAGYLNYDGTKKRFTLPAEHAAVLAQENGPFFVGGMYQMLPAQAGVFDQVVSAFRSGGGVSQSQYNDMMWDGLERFTSTWFENLLLQQWIPAMPDVKAHLERGCDVADVGCGRGRGAHQAGAGVSAVPLRGLRQLWSDRCACDCERARSGRIRSRAFRRTRCVERIAGAV